MVTHSNVKNKVIFRVTRKKVHTFLSVPLITMNVSPRASMVSKEIETLPLLTVVDARL